MSSERTLSLRCPCGYIKHDVMHIGKWVDYSNKVVQFCGGLFLIDGSGNSVSCKKCGNQASKIDFFCSFCSRNTEIGVQERIAKAAGKIEIMQMSIHKTVIFSR